MERKKKILSKNRRQHWDTRGSREEEYEEAIEKKLSRVDFCGSQRWIECKSCHRETCANVCVWRIVSKVSKLISVEEEETQVAQGESGSCGRGSPLELLANHCTRPNGNGQQLSAAPTVSCAHCQLLFPPPLLSYASNIYMACGVCLLCVCAWKFSTLFAGRRKSKEGGRGGEAGTGRRDSLLHLLWRQTVKGISVMLGLLWASPSLHSLALLQFSPTTFPLIPLRSCYLPHSVLPSNLAALYHNVKVTFWKSAQRERKITFTHTQQPLLPSLSLSLSPSLCHTHVNTFSHRLVAFALFLLLLLFSLCILSFSYFSLLFLVLSLKLFTCAAVAWQLTARCLPRPSAQTTSFSLSLSDAAQSALVSVFYQTFKFVDNMLRLIAKNVCTTTSLSVYPSLSLLLYSSSSPAFPFFCSICVCLLQLNKSIDWFLRCVRLRCRNDFYVAHSAAHFSRFPAVIEGGFTLLV